MEVLGSVREYLQGNPTARYVLYGASATAVLYLAAKRLLRSPRQRNKRSTVPCPPGSVLLYQSCRGPYTPSLSPFPMKLETYLRIAKIPFVTDVTSIMSRKDKTPWISYNGQDVTDTHFCIEFLAQKFGPGADLTADFSKEQKAMCEALRVMVDEHMYWHLGYFRYVYDDEYKVTRLGLGMPKLVVRFVIRPMAKKALYAQGTGRHSTEEILHLLKTALRTLSDTLGEKEFLLGDRPCEADCSAFGLLAQLVWNEPYPPMEGLVEKEFPNLYNYCVRMKDKFWSDWDDCTTRGGTAKATR